MRRWATWGLVAALWMAACVLSLDEGALDEDSTANAGNASAETAAAPLVPSRAEAEPFCFLSYGCWGGNGVPNQKAIAEVMGRTAAAHKAKFVIAAGDNFYNKGVTSVDDPRFETTFERVYSHPGLASLPFLVALGNHDYRGNFWAQVNYTGRGSGRWFLPHPYYERRFDAASLSVIVLDCPLLERCDANRGKERWAKRCWDQGHQHVWFKAALARAARDGVRFRVVVCHYPMYANGPHVNHQWLIDLVEPAMKAHGAQLYINADNHYLQVSRHGGIAYVNSGGGAGLVLHKPTDRGYKKNAFNVFEALAFGVGLHCVVDRDVLRTRLIDQEGRELFQFDVRAADSSDSGTSSRSPARMRVPGDGSRKDAGAAFIRAEDADSSTSLTHDGTMDAAVVVLVCATVFVGMAIFRQRAAGVARGGAARPRQA